MFSALCVCENRSQFLFPSRNFCRPGFPCKSQDIKWVIISNVDRQDYSCKECWGPLNILTENQYHLALEYVQKHVECGVLYLINGYFLEKRVACAASHITCGRTEVLEELGVKSCALHT